MFAFLRRNPLRQAVENFYVELAGAARNPHFFTVCNVPDTLEGRFEVLVLHAALVQLRLKTLAGDAEKVSQLLTDSLFADLDAAIREAGVSDVGVPRKMKMLAEAYFGRLSAYEAMMKGEREVVPTLAKNVLATNDGAADHPGSIALSNYVAALAGMLQQKGLAGLLALRGQEIQVLTHPRVDALGQ